ncbi:MAG: hypothetical protein U5L01_15365 [Rheinheimera sp.]|nr:hypothetical protein [Rheinheimera sp.]
MAEVFNAPIIIKAASREGTMRGTANSLGIPIILYEAGEALRFDEQRHQNWCSWHYECNAQFGHAQKCQAPRENPLVIFQRKVVGSVPSMMVLLVITSALGKKLIKAISWRISTHPTVILKSRCRLSFHGIIIGRNNLPLINEGEALFHIAEVSELEEAEKTIDAISDEVDNAMPAVLGGDYGVV